MADHVAKFNWAYNLVLRESWIFSQPAIDSPLASSQQCRAGGAMIAARVASIGSIAALALAGCDSFRGAQEPVEPPAVQVAAVTRNYSVETAVATYYATAAAGRQEYRDRVVWMRMLAIEARYQTFVRELRGARAGVGLGADLITMILGGLGTFVAGETTKAVLAAGTAVIAGSRVSFDKNLFYDQTLPAIVAQMDAERTRQILLIRQGLSKPDASYSLPEALVDLAQLERLGSIETAIKKITETATNQARDADAKLQTFILSRSVEDQRYMLSDAGRTKRAELIAAIARLDDTKATQLALKPPVKNETADSAVANMIPAGGTIAPNQARFILRMRIRNALTEKELQAWEDAFK